MQKRRCDSQHLFDSFLLFEKNPFQKSKSITIIFKSIRCFLHQKLYSE